MIEGYCTRRSYVASDDIDIHLSTDAPTLSIKVIRQGANSQVVFEKEGIPGRQFDVPADVVENGCGWPVGYTLKPDAAWPSGFYRILLSSAKGSGEACFILRARLPSSRILWVVETNTWNAYNFYGGRSTYTADGASYSGGAPRVSFLRPLPPGFISLPPGALRLGTPGTKERPLPYADWAAAHNLTVWTGAAGWGQWGSTFAKWLDSEGVQVDYAASSDLEEFPDLLSSYRLMLSVGHDEYWSWEMRDAVEAFIARGGNVAFLSGNCCYWQVRLEKDRNQMVAHKAAVAQDPVIGTECERHNTGIWSHLLTRRPENQMTGVSFTRAGYARIAGATPESGGGYTIYRPDHWALKGSGLTYGDLLGAEGSLVSYETDGCAFQFQDGLPVPTGVDGTALNFEIIAIAPATLFSRQTAPPGLYPEGELVDVELVAEQVTGRRDTETVRRFQHGHAVMGSYVSPSGGTVFTSGTTEWAFCLGDPRIACITRNILERLGRA